jgi:hypothetical protein
MENCLKRILLKWLPSESKVSEKQLQIYTLYTKINGTNIYLVATWRKYCLLKLPVRANSFQIHSFSLVSMATQCYTRHFLVHQQKAKCIILSVTSWTNILVSEWETWRSYGICAEQQLSLLATVSTLPLHATVFFTHNF